VWSVPLPLSWHDGLQSSRPVVTAVLAYINARVRLPSAIRLMATALLGSLLILALDSLEIRPLHRASRLLEQVNLSCAAPRHARVAVSWRST
jgi:hypothetical protein